MEVSRRADGLPLRVERLIDEISDFHGHTRERTEQAQAQDLAALDQAGFEHFKQAGQAGAIHRTPRDQARGPCVAP